MQQQEGESAGRNLRNGDFFWATAADLIPTESWQGLLADEDDEPLALVVNPARYRGAHFATFPPRLIEPMIKASTSERGQCATCSAPWVRVVERGALINPRNGSPSSVTRGDSNRSPLHRPDKQPTSGAFYEAASIGWRPSCAHTDREPVPQTILDPFGGSGCTGLVADRLGRNAILCELNPEYGEQAVTRVTSETPMFTEIDVA